MSVAEGLSAADPGWHSRRDAGVLAARRHSRYVRALRVALPLSAVGAVAGFTAYARLALPPDEDFSAVRLSVTRNAVIMDDPHLTGRDAKGKPFLVTADKAMQAWSNPEAVSMNAPTAAILAAGYGSTQVTAVDGAFDAKAARLSLTDGVKITTEAGYTLALRNVRFDMKTGTMTTREPVTISFGSSETRGTSMTVSDSGSVIVVTGVTTVLMPPRGPGKDGRPKAGRSETGPVGATPVEATPAEATPGGSGSAEAGYAPTRAGALRP